MCTSRPIWPILVFELKQFFGSKVEISDFHSFSVLDRVNIPLLPPVGSSSKSCPITVKQGYNMVRKRDSVS